MLALACVSLLLGCPIQTEASVQRLDPALSQLIANDAKPEKLAEGFTYVEGPLWMPEGFLIFSEMPAHRIMKWEDGKGLSTYWVAPPEAGPKTGPNGSVLDDDGNLITCDQDSRRVFKTTKTGAFTVVVDQFEGKKLNSPNDIVRAPNGDLYFTDPTWGLPKWNKDPAKELPFDAVFRLSRDHKLSVACKDLNMPNGLAFSPDHKLLYVADSDPGHKIWQVYDVEADGSLSHSRLFVDVQHELGGGVPDGMRVDERGNIWATGPGGIRIYTPQAKLLGIIRLPEQPANLVFGGKNGHTLYITDNHAIFRLAVKVGGAK